MNGRAFRKTFGGLLALAALSLTAACDGIISVRGRVYEQRKPGAQSRAFIDRPSEGDLSGLVPLADAKVTLYHGENFEKGKLEASKGFKTEALTTDSGTFDIGGTTAPYKFDAALVVEKPGYRPVTEIFTHGGQDHNATIILVPDTQP